MVERQIKLHGMIADPKFFTLKKSQKTQLVFAILGISILVLTGIAAAGKASLAIVFLAVVLQTGAMVWFGRNYIKDAKDQSEPDVEAKLADMTEHCAARTRFIESIGKDLLETSRELFEAASFLGNTDRTGQTSAAAVKVEKELLAKAECIYCFSKDMVALTQLRSGEVQLLEQEIDPVELAQFCLTEVCKTQSYKNKIVLEGTPANGLLLKGDLSRLKQLLQKLFVSAIRQMEVKGATVRVNIFSDQDSRLVFSVKLDGRNVGEKEFLKLCCPLENNLPNDKKMELDMAIAKKLAILHGGDIVIYEQTSSGTVLAVFFPASRISKIPLQTGRARHRMLAIELVG